MKIANPNFKLATLALCAAGLVTSVAQADEYHYNNVLIGDRAVGLAGAFTAISDDPSGLWYNPAGIVYSPQTKISASANAYNATTYKYDNINASDLTWTRESSGMIANFFGLVQPFAGGMAGFAIVIPDSQFEDQNDVQKGLKAADQNYTFDQVFEYNNQDSSTYMGPAFGYAVSDRLSVGGGLYYYSRKREAILSQNMTFTNDTNNLTELYVWHYQTSESGIMPLLSVMFAPIEKLSLGVSVRKTFILSQTPEVKVSDYRNFGIVKSGSGSSATTTFDTTDEATFDVSTNPYHGAGYYSLDKNPSTGVVSDTKLSGLPEFQALADRVLPWQMTFGGSYFINDKDLITGDFTYYTSTDSYKSTYNFAIAGEHFFDDTWAMRGGVYTNNGNTDISSGGDQVDLTGLALGVSRYTKDSAVNLGFNYASGKGSAQLNSSGNRIQGLEISNLAFYVSTSSSF